MNLTDLMRLTLGSLVAYRLRSLLTALGIAIGIAAVALLTAIGEGIHQFVVAEFSQFGTNLIAINPGKTTTHGASIGVFGSDRPLSIDDAEALRRIPQVIAVVPALQGNAEVATPQRRRRTTVYGMGPDMPQAFKIKVASGQFLPPDNPTAPRALAVLGARLQQELFGETNPLGQLIRIGDERYRIVGTLEHKGQVLGIDLDDSIHIPAARAMQMFNRAGLMEIDVVYREQANVDTIVASIKRILTARHGRDDVTITTQQEMLETLSSILDILTFAVAALGGISLVVGAVGITTIMTIAITERTSEIGLLRALGATRRQILALFLSEAVLLAAAGGLAGLIIGIGGAYLLSWAIPMLPVHPQASYIMLAEGLAIIIGLVAGVVPALRAAHKDPVEALQTE
ncbi:MAG: ABC transporter permease [Gammaproteobacteria bacterium]|nr:ABC transporter permease [Gammaproteobacteria bacterium]